jgi:hypothetical protein
MLIRFCARSVAVRLEMIAYQPPLQEVTAPGNFAGLQRSRPGKALATRMGVCTPKPYRTPRPIPSDFDAPVGLLRATIRHGHNRKYANNRAKGTILRFANYNAQGTASPRRHKCAHSEAGCRRFRARVGGGRSWKVLPTRLPLRTRLDGPCGSSRTTVAYRC